MRVHCHLREIRGRRSLRSVAAAAGRNHGELSLIELGRLFPKDEWLPLLERAYGRPRHDFYPPEVLLLIQRDDERAREGGTP